MTLATIDERGSITAEFALLLPIAVALVVAIVSLIGVETQLSQTAGEMASIARAVEAGPGSDDWRRLANRFSVGFSQSQNGNLLCLNLSKNVALLNLGNIPVRQVLCALPVGK